MIFFPYLSKSAAEVQPMVQGEGFFRLRQDGRESGAKKEEAEDETHRFKHSRRILPTSNVPPSPL